MFKNTIFVIAIFSLLAGQFALIQSYGEKCFNGGLFVGLVIYTNILILAYLLDKFLIPKTAIQKKLPNKLD